MAYSTMLATPLPEMLREAMADFGMGAVEGWWSDLDDSARDQVIQLWRETSFGQSCEAFVSARYVENGEEEDDEALWNRDFYEYLVNHEAFSYQLRRYHICTAHPKARAAVEAGFIPATFLCPLEEEQCPMRLLLRAAGGRSVKLQVGFAPRSED